ncbi:MAG: hypothetical protein LQ347_005700, partial [Umbilicaria vellea]
KDLTTPEKSLQRMLNTTGLSSESDAEAGSKEEEEDDDADEDPEDGACDGGSGDGAGYGRHAWNEWDMDEKHGGEHFETKAHSHGRRVLGWVCSGSTPSSVQDWTGFAWRHKWRCGGPVSPRDGCKDEWYHSMSPCWR